MKPKNRLLVKLQKHIYLERTNDHVTKSAIYLLITMILSITALQSIILTFILFPLILLTTYKAISHIINQKKLQEFEKFLATKIPEK